MHYSKRKAAVAPAKTNKKVYLPQEARQKGGDNDKETKKLKDSRY